MFHTFPRSSGVLAALLLLVAPVQAQVGGLIRRATQRAATTVAPAEPDVYTTHLLELTPDVLNQVITGKEAGKQFAVSADGAVTLRAQQQAAQQRAEDIRERNRSQIDSWQERLQRGQNCADSAYVVVNEQRRNEMEERMMNDPVLRQKIIALTPRIAAAQQKADTAELQRLNLELQALAKPTAADSAAIDKACPLPAAPAAVQQLATLQQEVDSLQLRVAGAEAEQGRTEERVSALTTRQLGLACERIRIYVARIEAKQAQKGFSATELAALESRKDDLERLCK